MIVWRLLRVLILLAQHLLLLLILDVLGHLLDVVHVLPIHAGGRPEFSQIRVNLLQGDTVALKLGNQISVILSNLFP